MQTKIDDYPKKVQAAIRREAKRRGLSVEKLLANADALSSGKNHQHRPKIVSAYGRMPQIAFPPCGELAIIIS